jgi:hypothetical protein
MNVEVEARLRERWTTMDELRGALRCSRQQALKRVYALAGRVLVFRRLRRGAKWKPKEYRVLPQAFEVRAS